MCGLGLPPMPGINSAAPPKPQMEPPVQVLRKFDLWLGKTLFIPPIVKLCHLTRQSQYAVSRLFWFMAMLSGLYRADNAVDYLIFGLGSFFMMLTASLRADRPTASWFWFRMVVVLGLILRLFSAIEDGTLAGVEYWIFILFAEYAATIRTLPPRASAERKQKLAEAGEG